MLDRLKARLPADPIATAELWFRPHAGKAGPAEIAQPGPQHANAAPTFSAPALQLYRASTTSDGSPLNGYTYSASISPDGTRLAFTSQATNAVSGDVSGFSDIFLRNLLTGEVTLVTRTAGGQAGSSNSGSPFNGPFFSPDGNRLLFDTTALNLGAEFVSGQLREQVSIKDLVTGTVTRVSETANGTAANIGAYGQDWSPDGTSVLLYSWSTNLVAGDTNDQADLFLKDLTTGAVTRVSEGAAGEQANFRVSLGAEFSPDGTRVVFVCAAGTLVAGDTNNREDVFVKNLATGALDLISRSANGTIGDDACFDAHFSPDGTKVLFSSTATNLVAGDTNNSQDLFLKDLVTGAITRVSSGPNGEQYFFDARTAQFSPDGTKIVFAAQGSLYPGDSNGQYDVFMKDLVTGAVTWVTTMGDGPAFPNLSSTLPFFLDNGTIAFQGPSFSMIGGVNAGPGAIFTASPATRYLENGVPLQILSSVNIGDSDSANYAGGTLSIAITSGAEASDRLVFTPDSAGPGFGLELVGDDVRFRSASVGTLTKTDTSYSILLKATADDEAIQAMVRAASFFNLSEAPSATARTVTFTLVDGGGTLGGGQDSASFTRTITVLPVDDPTIGKADLFVAPGQVIAGNLFADNGAGIDTDIDSAPAIAAINGVALVGPTVTLPSGALLTVSANGNFTYDRNTAFANGIGAIETFTYRPQAGNAVTVTIQIAGTTERTVTGTAASEELVSTSMVEELVGLGGNDTYRLDHYSDVAREAVGGGFDTVYVATGHSLAAGSEVEVLAAADAAGTFAITLIGNEFGQTLIGNAGNNTLIGEGGADTLIGGAGNDSYRVEEAGDLVLEAVGGGFDSVYTLVSYTLANNREVEALLALDPDSTAPLVLTGNEFDNFIFGNAGSNTLIGGAGSDTLLGGAGNDFYRVEDSGDKITESVGGGIDSVYAVGNYTLIAGAEVELLSAIDPSNTVSMTLVGNEFDNFVIGNEGVNTLIGGAGSDTLIGNGGNDFYRVEDSGDKIAETGGGGFDSAYAVGNYTLAGGAEVEVLSAIDPANAVAMTLIGNEFDNFIIGNNGSNTLIGGSGSDTLIGNGGDDFYRVEDSGDKITETGGGGFDSAYAVGNYTLQAGAEVELLSAIDPANSVAMNLTGNAFANRIYGNNGANVLTGGGGLDLYTGGGGADTFVLNAAPGAGNVVTIADMVSGVDKLAFDDAVFAGIGSPGSFNAAAFVVGTTAADADDRLVYDSGTGQLFYDADGIGGAAGVLIATLTGNPALAASDFMVI